MKIAPRLARPAAVAALAAAALAIPATSASAEQQECRAGMLETANYELMWSVRYLLAGDVKNFKRTVEAVSNAATAYGIC
jgi:hypothetical protein